ncbi:MAG: CinA family protein [Pseudomonadota bacterium]
MHNNAPLYETQFLTQAYELAKELGALLKTRHLMLTLAESCTGGMVAETMTSVAGSSAWFDCGFVTYSNQSKINLLGVPSKTLQDHGAVSEETAKEMAFGCLSRVMPNNKHDHNSNNSRTHIAGSITGIAGPDGGTAEKPVGTVCFAWAGLDASTINQTLAQTKVFSGNRQQIRHQATIFMLEVLIKKLKPATI